MHTSTIKKLAMVGENNCTSFRCESRNSSGTDNKADRGRCNEERERERGKEGEGGGRMEVNEVEKRGWRMEDAIAPSDKLVCRTTKWILRVQEK